MASTNLIGLLLPATGTLSGQWGGAVNNAISQVVDAAVAGTQTISTDADATLTVTEGAYDSTGLIGTSAQYAIIRWTANGSVTRNITVPAQSKTYVVINDTASTQSIVIRGAGPTTGVTVAAGERTIVAWTGSDFESVGGGSAAGADTQLQFNDGGAFGASSGMTWDGTTLTSTGFGGPLNGTLTNATGLPPAGVVGTAAILGANTFTGLQNQAAGADIASATTLDLTAATGNTVVITGTTTTTGFTMVDGQQMILLPSGAWPITFHATTANINGGVSYTCAAGDRVYVVRDLADVIRVSVIKQDGTAVVAGAAAGAAGADTQLQFNDGGAFGASSGMTWDGTTLTATGFGGPINGTVGATTPASGEFTTVTASTAIGVASGGTGAATLTANNVLLGNGTSALQAVAPGTSGNVLVSNGTTWTSAAAAASGVSQAKATMISMVFGF